MRKKIINSFGFSNKKIEKKTKNSFLYTTQLLNYSKNQKNIFLYFTFYLGCQIFNSVKFNISNSFYFNVYVNFLIKNHVSLNRLHYNIFANNNSVYIKNISNIYEHFNFRIKKNKFDFRRKSKHKNYNFITKNTKKKTSFFKVNRIKKSKNVINYNFFLIENLNYDSNVKIFKNKKKLLLKSLKNINLEFFNFKKEIFNNTFYFNILDIKKYYNCFNIFQNNLKIKITFYSYFFKKTKVNFKIEDYLPRIQVNLIKYGFEKCNFFKNERLQPSFDFFKYVFPVKYDYNVLLNNNLYLFVLVKRFNLAFFSKSLNFNRLNVRKLDLTLKLIHNLVFFKSNFDVNLMSSNSSDSSFFNEFNNYLDHRSMLNPKVDLNYNLFNKGRRYYYNNHYPVFIADDFVEKKIFNKFRLGMYVDFFKFIQLYCVGFLEYFFKKRFFIRVSSNHFNHANHTHINYIYSSFRNNKFKNLKNFKIIDFIEIVWYSIMIRDLSLMSVWISKYMESLNFKGHRRFLVFFQNFFKKYGFLFIDVLKIEGFYFDIRGKVGVTGNSKKRHTTFKVGSLKRSSKNFRIDFNQNLVRTPSGVMGLTYILSY